MQKTITRRTCRLCGGKKLSTILSLGNLAVSNFVKRGEKPGPRAPLELVLCGNTKCSLLQLKHTAPQEIMYARHYWYRSGLNKVIIDDLKDIAQRTQKMVKMRPGDVVLDIGANDGTFLSFIPKKFVRVGCEPADNLQKELRLRASHVIHDFWESSAYDKLKLPKAKIVTAIGMFYDSEDPNQFVGEAAKALAPDGVFVAQLMTLAPMIEKNDVGNICHEHLEYYSYPSLVYLFERNGLEIFKVEKNSINGGSYRLYARKFRRGSIQYPEPKFDYRAFARRLEANKKACVDFIRREVKNGKTVYGYGASTKGNTILQYYGLDRRLITAIADKSKEKWGKYTVRTMIPIVSEDAARKANPNYFIIFPWAFANAFIAREKEWLSRGGKFIVPIPKFRIVGKR